MTKLIIYIKVKVKITLEQATKAQRESRGIALSLTLTLDGVGGQRHAAAALPKGNTRYPLYRRLGWPQGRSGRVRKISPPPGFDPRTVQPVASRYTDCAIPALLNIYIYILYIYIIYIYIIYIYIYIYIYTSTKKIQILSFLPVFTVYLIM